MNGMFEFAAPLTTSGIVPREYQSEDLESSFALWDGGERGVLTRVFTGGGKTICACLKADRWLARGDEYKCLVLSYEKQLVWQFAEEIHDVLGVTPGIEMERESLSPGMIPQVVVASRQTLQRHDLATVEQRDVLNEEFGINELCLTTKAQAKSYIQGLRKDAPVELVLEQIDEWKSDYRCNHELNAVSRIFKFDNKMNWLVIWDEAHKHAYGLATVGHIVDWFRQNPDSRDNGLTATPKRSDGISIGTTMFPGVAIDYPLFRVEGRCAVKDGYAVPYKQKYIVVESLDFKNIKELSGNSQEKWDAELAKLLETELATCIEPMLAEVGDLRTLCFWPSVHLVQEAANYINARSPVRCVCGWKKWLANELVEDGVVCDECGEEIAAQSSGIKSMGVWGSLHPSDRKEIYRQHQTGEYQFLQACGLCREGYNDQEIACVAIFRPVSKEASSLAEQMKGRGSRVLPGIIDGIDNADERVAAIATSDKPYALIIDLVGVTGLGDCATTVQIYSEGLDDEVATRAQEIAERGGVAPTDIAEAIKRATEEIEEERELRRLERLEQEKRSREAAEQRAKARVDVKYTTHDRGVTVRDSSMPSEKQLRYIRFLGMEFCGWEPSRGQTGRIITQLLNGIDPQEVARTNRIEDEQWEVSTASVKQKQCLSQNGIQYGANITPQQASDLIDRVKNPEKFKEDDLPF